MAPRPKYRPEMPWRDQGACNSAPTSVNDLYSSDPAIQDLAARLYCANCPVKQPCLEYALVNKETAGVWGGVPERHRKNPRWLRRLRSLAA